MVRKGKNGSLHLLQVRHFLESGRYLSSVHITERSGIRKSAKKFIVEGKRMYYTGLNRTEKRLVLFTLDEKNKAFHDAHIIPVSGDHCGRSKTLRRLSEKFYWTCMVEDVIAMIMRCKTCEWNRINHPNQRFIRVTEPWEVVSIDIIGQFVASDEGHAFLAVIIDMFTKFTYAIPMRDTTIVDIWAALQNTIYIQGPPKRFISDQNEDFIHELNETMYNECKLQGIVVPVSKLQLNRPDEASIKSQLLQTCLASGTSWRQVLPKKVYELNTTHEVPCGKTPFYMMYHRAVRSYEASETFNCSNITKPTFVVREEHTNTISYKNSMPCKQVGSSENSESMPMVKLLMSSGLSNNPSVSNSTDITALSSNNSKHLNCTEEENSNFAAHENCSTNIINEHEREAPDHNIFSDNVTTSNNAKNGGLVYQTGDGEGQVVVVADGLVTSNYDSSNQEMVIVQTPDVTDKNMIMIRDNQGIMNNTAHNRHQINFINQT